MMNEPRVPFFLQLGWMLWKNYRLKCRNWKSTLKELAFPIYTFALIALLKVAMNIDVEDTVQEWDASPISSLDHTRSGYACRMIPDRSASDKAKGGIIRFLEGSDYTGTFSMFGKSQPGSPGQVADESSCRFLLSPATDHIVAKVGNALTRRLQTTGIDVLSLDNLTAAKRYHLEHPGHVIAAVDLSFDGLCFDNRSDSSECLVKYQALINSTRLLEVRAGLYPQVEEEVGFLSVQQLMYDSILDVLPQFVSSTILPPNAGRVGLLTKPFPSASSGLSLAS
jgi:hypothetical protein